MRNLKFRRQWRVTKEFGTATVDLFSHAWDESGDYVVTKTLSHHGAGAQDVRTMRRLALKEAEMEEAAFLRGEGPTFPKFPYYSRKNTQKFLNDRWKQSLALRPKRISYAEFASGS